MLCTAKSFIHSFFHSTLSQDPNPGRPTPESSTLPLCSVMHTINSIDYNWTEIVAHQIRFMKEKCIVLTATFGNCLKMSHINGATLVSIYILSFSICQFVSNHPKLWLYTGLIEGLLFWEVASPLANVSLTCLSLWAIISWSPWFCLTRFKMGYYVTSDSKNMARYLKEGKILWDNPSCCSSIFNVHTHYLY